MLLPTNHTDLVGFLVRHYHSVRDQVNDWREDVEIYWDLFDGWVDEDAYPFRFAAFIPVIRSTIKTITPRFATGLLYRFPLFQMMKGHPLTPRTSVDRASRLVNKWHQDPETWLDILMGVEDSLIAGTAGFTVDFVRRKQWIPKYDSYVADGIRKNYEDGGYWVNEINRPVLDHHNMANVYPDVERKSPAKMRFVMSTEIVDISELTESEEEYTNLDEVANLGAWPVDEWDNYARRDYKYNVSDDAAARFPDGKPIHVLTCDWRQFTPKGVIVWQFKIANEKVLIKKCKKGYWRWSFLRNDPDPHRFYGSSEVEGMKDLNLLLNDSVNMMMENQLMDLTKMWLVGDGAEADLSQFVLDPFGVIQVADISQVKSVEFPGNLAGQREVQGFLTQMLNQSSGVQDYSRGVTPPRKEFATTVMALQQAAEARIDFKIKVDEITWLSPQAMLMLKCAQHELDEPDYVLTGEKTPDGEDVYDEIDMYAIQGLHEMSVSAAARGRQEMQRASLVDFTASVAQLLPDATIDLRVEIIKAVAQTYEGMDEFVRKLDEVVQAAQNPNPQVPAGAAGNPQADGGAGLVPFAAALAQAQTAGAPGIGVPQA